jgi:predicted outer membrane lipoprotein
LLLRTNPGLELANAFGVNNPGLELANAFGVNNPGWN